MPTLSMVAPFFPFVFHLLSTFTVSNFLFPYHWGKIWVQETPVSLDSLKEEASFRF